jgi:hypothetical protein
MPTCQAITRAKNQPCPCRARVGHATCGRHKNVVIPVVSVVSVVSDPVVSVVPVVARSAFNLNTIPLDIVFKFIFPCLDRRSVWNLNDALKLRRRRYVMKLSPFEIEAHRLFVVASGFRRHMAKTHATVKYSTDRLKRVTDCMNFCLNPMNSIMFEHNMPHKATMWKKIARWWHEVWEIMQDNAYPIPDFEIILTPEFVTSLFELQNLMDGVKFMMEHTHKLATFRIPPIVIAL